MKQLKTRPRIDLIGVLMVLMTVFATIDGPFRGQWAKGTFFLVLAFWLTWTAVAVRRP